VNDLSVLITSGTMMQNWRLKEINSWTFHDSKKKKKLSTLIQLIRARA